MSSRASWAPATDALTTGASRVRRARLPAPPRATWVPRAPRSARCLGAVALLVFAAALWPVHAHAQQAGRVYRIGYLGTLAPTPSTAHISAAFAEGLREHGWVEGRNVVIERRYAEGRPERFADFSTEFVRAKVDVIVAVSTQAALAAKQTTTTVPIVTILPGDPVGSGLVASLSRPGGNVTGLSSQARDFTAKNLELIRTIVPAASRIAAMWNPTQPAHVASWKEAEVAARALRIDLLSVKVEKAEDLDDAFAALVRERPGALHVFDDVVTSGNRQRIVDFATGQRLPAMYLWRFYVDAGGLMSHGPSLPDLFRRAAVYIDKILRGARPGELPVEQPTKFELVLNMKAARAIGLTIPESVRARADEVVE